jgi:hypothetical protein
MRRSLTTKDKKDLRNQCRMGLGISLLFFMLTTIIGVTIYELAFNLNPNTLNTRMAISISIGTLTFSTILSFLINHKYYMDLLSHEKFQEIKTLVGKCKTIDYAAGRGYSMTKAYINRYEFIVDNIKFRVEQELFESCSEGDKLIFNYATKSNYLLSIEKK